MFHPTVLTMAFTTILFAVDVFPALAATAPKINAKGGALGAAGAITGTIGVVDSVSGQGQHNWGNVLEGAVSGATATAGGAAIINAIPGLGQIGYGTAIAVGAVVGGVISGSQLFSETDCLDDPITKKFTCCNTVFNKGERLAKIGDYMFCGIPGNNGETIAMKYGVRQCLQGDSDQELPWWKGMWHDDHWSAECKERLCAGVKRPDDENGVVWDGDQNNICWFWKCAEDYKLQGNACVYVGDSSGGASSGAQPGTIGYNPYDAAIQVIQNEISRIQSLCGQY